MDDALLPPVYTILEPAPVRIDGIPAAVTTNLGIDNDLSGKGTGTGQGPWSQAELNAAALRSTATVTPERLHVG